MNTVQGQRPYSIFRMVKSGSILGPGLRWIGVVRGFCPSFPQRLTISNPTFSPFDPDPIGTLGLVFIISSQSGGICGNAFWVWVPKHCSDITIQWPEIAPKRLSVPVRTIRDAVVLGAWLIFITKLPWLMEKWCHPFKRSQMWARYWIWWACCPLHSIGGGGFSCVFELKLWLYIVTWTWNNCFHGRSNN